MGNSEEFEDELSRMKERKSRGRSRSQTSTQKKENETLGGAKKPSKNPKKSKKRTALRIVIILLEVLVLLGIAAYVYVTSKFNQVQRVEDWKPEEIVNIELTPEQKEVMKGYKTIAVFGVDARDNKQLEKGTHSDVIMICNINMDTGEIQLVSVFRDTYLNINDKNTYRKINQAYFDGGPTQAVKALNKNLDLNIEDYVTFNWKAVIDGINILGGVDIEINSKELRYLNAFITETVKATGVGSHQITKTGVIHMDGVQAVAYGRLRLMDSDYARTERQKIVVKAAFEKAKKAGILKLNELTGVMLNETSTSLDWGDIVPLAENISKFYLGDSLGFPMARGEMRLNGGDYVVPQTLESNVIELHKTLFESESYEPTASLKKISNHIASISGFTTPGKNAGTVVIGGDSGNSSTKETTKASTKAETTEDTEETEETREGESQSTSEGESNGEGNRRPEQVTDEFGNPIASESASGNSGNSGNGPNGPASSLSSSESSTNTDGLTPGNPSSPSQDPSQSNGDLIYEEPGKKPSTSESSSAQSSSAQSSSRESSSSGSLTPGGSGNESSSEVIITDKSPSEAVTTPTTTAGSQTPSASSSASSSNEPGRPSDSNDATIIVGDKTQKPTSGQNQESSSALLPDKPSSNTTSPINPGEAN